MNNTKKYLLTVFGDYKNEKVCQEMAICITPVVDSPQLKFQYSSGTVLFHFASLLEQSEIYDFLDFALENYSNAFILTEFNDNVSVKLPVDVKKHLYDLEEQTEGVDTLELDLNEIMDELTTSDDDDEFVALLLEEVKKRVKKPTLDQLLEKIQEAGVESLTPFEKGVLENYSK
jgi:hypothetical protein